MITILQYNDIVRKDYPSLLKITLAEDNSKYITLGDKSQSILQYFLISVSKDCNFFH